VTLSRNLDSAEISLTDSEHYFDFPDPSPMIARACVTTDKATHSYIADTYHWAQRASVRSLSENDPGLIHAPSCSTPSGMRAIAQFGL